MAFTNLAVFGGAFFTPILVGKITHTIGWPWTFYLEAIFCGVCLPAVIFLVPETAYRRTASLNTDMLSSDDIHLYHNEKPESGLTNSDDHQQINKGPAAVAELVNGTTTHKTRIEPGANTPKRSYLQSLSPFNGFITDDNFFAVLVRPFPLFFHPAILWGCLIQGALIGWTVFIGIILAAIFLGPPLWWGEVETGYAYTGAFTGAILGFILSGALSDWSAKYMTQKNGGVYEPEFRIVLVIPQLVFGCIGLFGFGVTSARLQDYHWVWPVFFFGMEVMGMVIGAVASALYLVDAHRKFTRSPYLGSWRGLIWLIGDIAIEAFTCLLIFKNFFSFGLTFSAYDWIVKGGIYNTFMIIGSLQIVICLLSVPMCKFRFFFTISHSLPLPPCVSENLLSPFANLFRRRYSWKAQQKLFPSARYLEGCGPVIYVWQGVIWEHGIPGI
jgi:MFS family permease